jgi:hypothetical protein
MTNPFYEAAVNHMAAQLAYLEKLVGRPLTEEEKENIHQFYQGLHPRSREAFEERYGAIL